MVVRADNQAYGEKACRYLGETLAGTGNVVEFQGDLASVNGRDRSEAFASCMSDNYPDIHVFEIPTEWKGDKAAAGLQTVLTQTDDAVDGIYMQAGGAFLAPTLALLDSQGLLVPAGQDGHIAIVSNDGIPQELDAIRDGSIDATVSQPADSYAYYGLYYAIAAAQGLTFEAGPPTTGARSWSCRTASRTSCRRRSSPVIPARSATSTRSAWTTPACGVTTSEPAPSDRSAEATPVLDGGNLPPVVETSGLTKRFGTTVALDDVSVAVAAGQTHALVGRNGAGKSTFVALITGLYAPDSGEIRFHGESAPPLSRPERWRGLVACVYQRSTVIGSLSVAENLFLNPDHRFISWGAMRRQRPGRARAARRRRRSGNDGQRAVRRAAPIRRDRSRRVPRRAVRRARRADRPARR